jgi:hypothetical protein
MLEDGIEPKKEEERVKFWLDRISIAKKFKERNFDDSGVERYCKYYKGEWDVRLGNMVVPPINEVFSYTQTLASLLNFRNPAIAVNPKTTGTILGGRILEQCVAYDWRELNIKDETDLELIDVPLSGMAWHKTGYWVTTSGKGDEYHLEDEGIYSTRVSWRDVVWNIGSIRPPKDCQWIAHRTIKPTEEVKQLYPGNSELKGGPHPHITKNDIKSSTYKDDLNYTSVWEIYDKKTRNVICVSEGYDKFLKKPSKWPDYQKEFPLDMLAFNFSPDEPFPIPDIKMIEPQIIEEIKLTAMAINHVKRWSRMVLIKKGAIDPSEQDKMEKGVDGSFIEVAGDPNTSHAVLQYGPLPPDVYAIINRIQEIRTRISGITVTDQGGKAVTGTRSLGELELMQKGSGLRTDKKRDRYERHLESIARKLIAIRQSNFDLDQIVKITGEPPQEIIQAFKDKYDPITKSIKFTKEDIQGEYDVEVQAGSTIAIDKSARMAILNQVLQQSIQLAQLPGLPPFVQVVISELLKDYEIKSLEEAFNVQSREADMSKMSKQQDEQTQTAKVQAETAKREAQAQEIKVDTVLKGADAMMKAHQFGVLPELIGLSRGAGVLPPDGGNGQQ